MKYVWLFLVLSACAIDARETPTEPAPVVAPAPSAPPPVAQPLSAPQTLDLRDVLPPIYAAVRADRIVDATAHLTEAMMTNQDGQVALFEARSYAMARLLWDTVEFRRERSQRVRKASEWRDARGRLALHVWSAAGRAQPVRYAIERWCDGALDSLLGSWINTPDLSGRTPVLEAVRSGDLLTVDLFVGCGSVDWTAADAGGRTVLHEAVERGDPAILRDLISRRPREMAALLDVRNGMGETPWIRALARGDVLALLTKLRK